MKDLDDGLKYISENKLYKKLQDIPATTGAEYRNKSLEEYVIYIVTFLHLYRGRFEIGLPIGRRFKPLLVSDPQRLKMGFSIFKGLSHFYTLFIGAFVVDIVDYCEYMP